MTDNSSTESQWLETLAQVTEVLSTTQGSGSKDEKLGEFVTLLGTSSTLVLPTSDSVSPETWRSYWATYVDMASALYEFGKVPNFKGREDIGYESSDFRLVAPRAVSCMTCFSLLIPELVARGGARPDLAKPARANLLALSLPALLLALEHADTQLWTSSTSVEVALQLISCLMRARSCSSHLHLMCGSDAQMRGGVSEGADVQDTGYFKPILVAIQPRLQRGRWKNSPSAKCIYSWALLHVKFPHMSDNLEQVLPPALALTDDHELENKVLGVVCLQHIMDNVSASEMRWLGRAGVVYDALQRHTYTPEPWLLDHVYPALLTSLHIIEHSPKKASQVRVENRYDEILDRLLTDMELEDRLLLRRAYARQLAPLLEAMGITVVRHFKRLLRVFTNYLEIGDEPGEQARANALKAIHVTLRESWPRVSRYCEFFFKLLVKFVFDVSGQESGETTTGLLLLAKTDLVTLRRVCPEQCGRLLHAVLQVDMASGPRAFIKDVIAAS